MLNHIKSLVSSSLAIQTKASVYRNQKQKHPVLATDISASATKGFTLTYLPQLFDGTRLYDASETFDVLSIPNFSAIHNMILSAHHYFLQGQQVEAIANNRHRAIYELPGMRLTVTSKPNSTSVVLNVTDATSPFYMLSISFTVTADKNAPGSYYVIGTEKSWNRESDTFETYDAYFASQKRRFIRVNSASNNSTIKAAFTGQMPDGSLALDTSKTAIEYIQVISSKYKALAYIVESEIMEFSFAKALEQGLKTAPAGQQPVQNSGFIPAFTLPGSSVLPSQPAPPANQSTFLPNNHAPFVPNNLAPFNPTQNHLAPGAPAPVEVMNEQVVANLIAGR